MNIFHTILYCFYCWLWASNCLLELISWRVRVLLLTGQKQLYVGVLWKRRTWNSQENYSANGCFWQNSITIKIKTVNHEILKLLAFDKNEKEKPLLKFRQVCRFLGFRIEKDVNSNYLPTQFWGKKGVVSGKFGLVFWKSDILEKCSLDARSCKKSVWCIARYWMYW